jgi:hypothetical protein
MNNSPIESGSSGCQTMSNRAWLAWDVSETIAPVPGQITEVNGSEVSVLVEDAPSLRVDATAWVMMEQPTRTEWVKTKVAGITDVTARRLLRRGPVVGHLVHLRFAGDCPYDFFKAATLAARPSDKPAAAVITEADRVIWR